MGLVSVAASMVKHSEALSGELFLFCFHFQVIAVIFELKAISASID